MNVQYLSMKLDNIYLGDQGSMWFYNCMMNL
jgi:hypothetical protein